MRKVIKILAMIVSAIVLLLIFLPVALTLILSIDQVQNRIVQRAATFASEKLDAKVDIGRIHIDLLSKVRIYDFYVEDGQAHIKCSAVKEIRFIHMRVPYHLHAAPYGEVITEASDAVRTSDYIRAVVVDTFGRRAWTNPIFLEKEDLK